MSESAPGQNSVESQKVSLAEQLLKYYWDSPQPFRKLNEHKNNGSPLPTGSEAWRILKLYLKFQSESLIPSSDTVAVDTGMDKKMVEALYELAQKENQG